MRSIKITLAIVCVLLTVVLIGCDRPEYYTPYGEGVDPDTVVTEGFQSRTTASMTAMSFAKKSTTTMLITTSTKVVVPEGYTLCPDCGGVREVCVYCDGTDNRPGEKYDPASGVYVRYYDNCLLCSTEDPGYLYCETCHNKLIVPN